MVNANELIAAGIGFQMRDEEVGFDESGELRGYSEVLGENWTPDENTDGGAGYENRWFSRSEGLTDTTEMSDDHDRWGHLADAHAAEMEAIARASEPRWSENKVDSFRLREFWQLVRERRAERLEYTAKKAAKFRQLAKLRRLRQGVGERYRASVKLVVARGSTEWGELLYLTREQYDRIMAV